MSTWKEEWEKTGKGARVVFAILAILGGAAFLSQCGKPDAQSKGDMGGNSPPIQAEAATPPQAVTVEASTPSKPLPEKGDSCMAAACTSGTKVVSIGGKDDLYFVCQTRQTAEYVNLVVGLIQAQAAMTGTLPNISPETGEPEYEGESKQMIDMFREKAGVQTLDEAMNNYCAKGKPGRHYMVMNNPREGLFIWVGSSANRQAMWFPKSSLRPL